MPELTELEKCQQKLIYLANNLEMFAQTTSHDLKDPLRQAVINCTKIEESCADQSTKKLIHETSQSVQGVIKRIEILRDLSYIINATELKKEEIDCNEVMQDVKDELRPLIDQTNASISYEALPVVTGHKKYMSNVFKHLVENAIQFRSDATPQIAISSEEQDTMWKFIIRDNGIGFDEIYGALIFTIFQKMQPDQNIDHFGSGLTFVKNIIEKHGGTVEVSSAEGQGSSFSFTLPK